MVSLLCPNNIHADSYRKNILFLAGNLRANKLAIQADLGYRVFASGERGLEHLYQKIGIRYYILKRKAFMGVRVKAHYFSRADYIK